MNTYRVSIVVPVTIELSGIQASSEALAIERAHDYVSDPEIAPQIVDATFDPVAPWEIGLLSVRYDNVSSRVLSGKSVMENIG